MFEIKFNWKDWKIQTSMAMVLMVQSRIFGILLRSILALIPNII
jgi:hypothetical protein